MWWKRKRQKELEEAYLEGYQAAKDEMKALVEQYIQTGAVLAYREVYGAMTMARTAEDFAEVYRGVEARSRMGS